jgi:helicase
MIDVSSTLNPAQRFVIESRMLDSAFSCVLQLPTGSGKTWLARRAIHGVLRRGFRAVYLTPLRALADEILPAWQQEFSPHSVGIFTGDYGKGGKDYPVSFADARVLIMTPERLDACTRAWRAHWHWLPQTDLIVVDEVHLLGERQRGARLEGAICRFRRLNPFCRFLCLSATLGNREEIADWLDGIEYESTWRAVPLTWRIARYRKADEKPGLLAQEVAQTRAAGGRSLVFVQSRRRSEVLAGYLRDQGIRAGYHHAGLTHKVRRSVESTFRASEIDALIATGTLEMGLNMPVRQVVLYDTQVFDGSQFTPLSVNTVWQRAGRAGRPGLDPTGEAVLFAPSWDRHADRYPAGRFERVVSSLDHPAALAEQVIAEVGSGLCRSEAQLKRAMAGTLAAAQRKPLPVAQAIAEMTQAGMIRSEQSEDEEDYGRIRLSATALGRIATRHLLHPATVLMMRTLFESVPDFTHFDAIFALGLTPDWEPVIPVDFEELPTLATQLNGSPSRVVPVLGDLRSNFSCPTGKRVLSSLKIAALLLNTCTNAKDDDIAKTYGVYPFEVVRLRETCARLLLAAAAISKHVCAAKNTPVTDEPPPKPEATRRLELLRHMVSSGLPADAATLTLVEGIGAKWAKKLKDLGFPNIGALASATLKDLDGVPGLSRKRAIEWLVDAQTVASSPIPSTEKDAPVIGCDAPETAQVTERHDPYRMRRAMELLVSTDETGDYIVTGGLEPHRVRPEESSWYCDCGDFAKGHVCKHIMAVKRHCRICKHDHGTELAYKAAIPGTLDLYTLWSEP